MNPKRFFVLTLCLCVLALAIALYMWQLRKREMADTVKPALPQSVAPPATGVLRQVTLWVARDESGDVQPQAASIVLPDERQRRAEEILRALLAVYTGKNALHRIVGGAEVRSVYFVDPGLAVVDINGGFAKSQASGVLSEELTFASLVQTLSANTPGVVRVKFLVDGKEANTLAGHADLSGSYDVSQVSALVKQLAAPK